MLPNRIISYKSFTDFAILRIDLAVGPILWASCLYDTTVARHYCEWEKCPKEPIWKHRLVCVNKQAITDYKYCLKSFQTFKTEMFTFLQ